MLQSIVRELYMGDKDDIQQQLEELGREARNVISW